MNNAINFETLDIYPVMGEKINARNSVVMDFTEDNKKLAKVDLSNTSKFTDYVFKQLGKKKFGYGGYLENRVIYRRSEHFQKGDSRSMHLGVDVWTKAYHPLFAPLDSVVHSFKDNNNFGDYGPTIILEHDIDGKKLYTLYGHLSLNSLNEIKEGDIIKKGSAFSELGDFPENGDWPPHLHFQVMTDLEGRLGDFPGVCAPAELPHYQKICLNPYCFI